MDPVEKAIRSALEKGNAADRAFREKVYRAAFAALERATSSQPQLTVEQAIKRRQNLQAKVAAIEAEYLPPPEQAFEPAVDLDDQLQVALEREAAIHPVAQAPSVDASVDPDYASHAPDVAAPSVALDHAPHPRAGAPDIDAGPPDYPVADAPVYGGPLAGRIGDELVEPDGGRGKPRRRRRPFAAMFLVLTFLCVAAIGAWWAYQTGLLSPSLPGLPSPPQLVEEEEFDPGQEQPGAPGGLGGTQELRNWSIVFTPDDPSTVNAPSGTTAEVDTDESGKYLHVLSVEPGAAVVFDVPQAILEEIVGKKAVFNISARTEEGAQTQISVSCDFGELGDCGRKRYAVGYERGEYLFDVSLPGNQPGASGSIAINSDFANEGKAVDIYEIRVSVVEEGQQ